MSEKKQEGRESASQITLTSAREFAAHSTTIEETLRFYQSSATVGLTQAEAARRLQVFGPNELRAEPSESIWEKVLEQFSDPMVKLLLIAAVISIVVSYLMRREVNVGAKSAESELPIWIEPLVIFLILIANALVGIYQDYNAEKSLEMLKRLQSKNCEVIREGHLSSISSTELVPGDIIRLRMGEIAPADCRVLKLSSPEFKVDESIFTGEPYAVSKSAERVAKEAGLAEKRSIVFSASTVQLGSALLIVTKTGELTELGNIKSLVVEAKEDVKDDLSPLKKQLNEFGDSLAKIIGAICIVVWLVSARKFFDEVHGGALLGALYYFKQAVALGVAAIPEGLPAVITTCLALGTRRMVSKNALVRKLNKVETLGCTTVICSDKTGTLTRNEMFASQLLVYGQKAEPLAYSITGEGYFNEGEVRPVDHQTQLDSKLSRSLAQILLLNCEGRVEAGKATGLPTECALITLGNKLEGGDQINDLTFQKIFEIPFTSFRKMMSYVVRDSEAKTNKLLTKGATEIIIEKSTKLMISGEQVVPLTPEMRQKIMGQANAMASTGLRVLGLAMRESASIPIINEISSADDQFSAGYKYLADSANYPEVEKDLTLVGLVGIKDPIRKEVYSALERCRIAGICVVMITGDKLETAEAIARELKIIDDQSKVKQVYSGRELDALTDNELTYILKTATSTKHELVFARTNPTHKNRIVKSLKSLGEIVSMTGDGVNDAPALKQASIGIAMGIAGSEVAKEASDIILLDDNFSSIVNAVEEGRTIYANMKAFIKYMISSNIGEVVSIFLASMLGIPEGFNSIQLLWVNLVTDGVPATALCFNPPDQDVMVRPPRPKSEPILNRWTLIRFFVIGTYVGIATVSIFVYYYTSYSWAGDGHDLISFGHLASWTKCSEWKTVAFTGFTDPCDYFIEGKKKASTLSLTVLVIIEMFNSLNAISENVSIFGAGVVGNPWLLNAIGLSIFLHCLILYVPYLNPLFSVVPLSWRDWLLVLLFSVPVIAIEEVLKWISRNRISLHSHKVKTD